MFQAHLKTSASALVVVMLVLTGLIEAPFGALSADKSQTTISAFDFSHSTIGSATLYESAGSLIVDPVESLRPSGVRVHAGDNSAMNLEFDPIHLEVGGVLTASLRGHSSEKLISVVHEQTTTGTDIFLEVGAVRDLLASPTITVSTYKDDVRTASFDIDASSYSRIGTVNTDDDDDEDWTKTYHYVCDEYGCALMVDPDDTVIRFVHDPQTAVPFQYLSFHFELKDGVDERTLVESLDLAGVLMDPIQINSGHTVPITFD